MSYVVTSKRVVVKMLSGGRVDYGYFKGRCSVSNGDRYAYFTPYIMEAKRYKTEKEAQKVADKLKKTCVNVSNAGVWEVL